MKKACWPFHLLAYHSRQWGYKEGNLHCWYSLLVPRGNMDLILKILHLCI